MRALAVMLSLVASGSGPAAAQAPRERAASSALLPRELALSGGVLEIDIDGTRDAAFERRAARWIDRAAAAVTTYYGRFPLARARLAMSVYPGRGIGGGRVVVTDVPTIHIAVGRFSEEVYGEWLDRMRLGQPAEGDRGLDRTRTWASTYWGGGLFALAADVEIRLRTGNRRGLQDALRGVVAGGGSINRLWPLARAFELGDRATGVSVLADSYARAATRPVAVDLDRLWRQLGLRRDGDRVLLDPAPAPTALRRAILERPSDRRRGR